ncbi:MAG TPA: helix-hairpin-helix domain-containing protein [Anaerolineaceae bacterium]|nr:helix-hairpin-helix domain-containing protein [Anaerolineaceae bacterium]
MKSWFLIAAGVLIGLIAAGIILLVSSPPRGEPIQLPAQPAPVSWVVQVEGAVEKPGIYSVPANSRVRDAIQQAGGLTELADENAVNLAAFLKDGQYIFVPEKGQASFSSVTQAAQVITIDQPVDINTATTADLDALPGIGPQKASDIVEYRKTHGPFQTIDDIQKVPGIGPAIFAQIKNFIRVGQP